jgi:hypothetical protein
MSVEGIDTPKDAVAALVDLVEGDYHRVAVLDSDFTEIVAHPLRIHDVDRIKHRLNTLIKDQCDLRWSAF